MHIMSFTRGLTRGAGLRPPFVRAVSTSSPGTFPTRFLERPAVPWKSPDSVQVLPRGLLLQSSNYKAHNNLIPWIWLRDNCRCAACVNPDTQQRQIKTFEIPRLIKGVAAELCESEYQRKQVNVIWDDGHTSTYDGAFLYHYLVSDSRPSKFERRPQTQWARAGPTVMPIVQYLEVMKSDDGVQKLTDLIRNFGFAFVDGTPYDDPVHTKSLLERIAFIRVTHYGGFYDFTADLAMADTAYTNIALPPHTDTTYFDDPAGLQAFHMLSHEPGPGEDPTALGGESLLIDGFMAASILREFNPEAFHTLKTVPLPWHASGNEGIAITPEHTYPVFEVTDDQKLHRIRWNNDDRGVVPFHPEFGPRAWYGAATKWNKLLANGSFTFQIQLHPGRTLIFDNWRVLHGRNAFTGKRRMCGGYINRNDFMSRWRTLNRTREEVQRHVMG